MLQVLQIITLFSLKSVLLQRMPSIIKTGLIGVCEMNLYFHIKGAHGSIAVKAVCYKLEDRGCET
jgi:hypothetical protein